jgi:TonB-dependent receptor
LLLGSALCLLWSGAAQAQDKPVTSPTDDEVKAEKSDEIVVTGLRAGIERSLQEKQLSVAIVDVISAEDIGKFPDNNMAESLQRIPGITIDRSELGEGRTINLRGLGAGFTRSEINGGSALNGFDFSVLAPELFSKIVVQKSPTASTVEGGLAGTVLLETPKPFDINGSRIVATAGATFGQKSDTVPRVFGLVSQNWGDTFGVTLAAAYSKTDFRTNEIAYGPWVRFRDIANPAALAAGPPELLDAATPRTSAYYSYIERRENIGGTLAVQARPSDAFDVTLDLIYAQSEGARHDDRPDIPIEGNNGTPTNYTIENGAVTSATFSNVQNRVGTSHRPQELQVYQGTLRAEWRPTDRLAVRPGLTYAQFKSFSRLNLYSFAINGATVSYDVNGDMPNFQSEATDFLSNPEDFGFNVFIFDKFEEKTDEYLAKLDFEYSFDVPGLRSIEFGARYTDRSTDRLGAFAGLFQGATLLGANPPALDAVFRTRDFGVGGAPAQTPSEILAVDTDKVESVFFPGLDPFDSDEFYNDPVSDALRSFTISEKTVGGYVQGNFDLGPLQVNAGLRVIHTKTNSSGTQLIDGLPSPRTDKGSYTNFLPAINARYALTDNALIRATYSRSVTRPDLDSLTPTAFINSGPRTGTRGNPNLRPYIADQADLGFEYYFHAGALVTATGFVKQIDSLITQTVVRELATFPDQLTGEPTEGVIAFTQPNNGDRATVKGLEAGLQSPFYFLPGILGDFGAIFNYTYASSKATIRNSDGSSRTTPLPGLSKHSANAVLYFDHDGIDARLAYTWRSTYLRADPVGRQFGAERYIRGFGQLDFSLNVPVTRNFELGVDVTNILDRQRKEYILIDSGAKMPANVIELGRRFTLTARAVF